MAGIYIHIPFCKQRCAYCDFHSSTALEKRNDYISAIKKELYYRCQYLSEPVETIYFGGGTPSLISPDIINEIIEQIEKHYKVKSYVEITLETNPDDLTTEYLQQLSCTPVNRLSIGVQSFHDHDLRLLNRRHTAQQAFEAVKTSKSYGFSNISVDLIYGIPESNTSMLLHNFRIIRDLRIQHLSAYHLTYEPGTALSQKIEDRESRAVEEGESIRQFQCILQETRRQGLLQYEISNFAQKGYQSRHNASYWRQNEYLGIGASAHSYNGESRQWNIADNALYIRGVADMNLQCTKETLTETMRFNDYLVTALRTAWGVDLLYTEKMFSTKIQEQFRLDIKKYIGQDILYSYGNFIAFTNSGQLIADYVISDLLSI